MATDREAFAGHAFFDLSPDRILSIDGRYDDVVVCLSLIIAVTHKSSHSVPSRAHSFLFFGRRDFAPLVLVVGSYRSARRALIMGISAVTFLAASFSEVLRTLEAGDAICYCTHNIESPLELLWYKVCPPQGLSHHENAPTGLILGQALFPIFFRIEVCSHLRSHSGHV
jgi:hypothetical protein